MELSAVAQVRRFNRTVTQRIGALDDAFLSRGRPLGHSRVLWEIGAEGSDVRGLRARLDLDSGYLSRVLRALEQAGLVVCEASPSDGRVRVARLTASGLRERAELDMRSDDAAAALLTPLTAAQQRRMLAAMAEVERLLEASMIQLTAREPGHPHARYCVGAYFAELADRFDGGVRPSAQPARRRRGARSTGGTAAGRQPP
jgi:DNA-binding MarR family transcriptional regulator